MKIPAGLLVVFSLTASSAAWANASVPELHVSEVDGERLRFDLAGDWADCGSGTKAVFDPSVGLQQIAPMAYSQRLNSEEGNSVYLKAARMGGGVYMHLPYFLPVVPCERLVIVVSARNILWGGGWHAGSIKIPAASAKDKSIFFTNEAAPEIADGRYFDSSIPRETRATLGAAFTRIVDFYNDGLDADPMDGIGVVAAIVRNDANYSGYGGDSLNIIRMSYDNPTAADLRTLGNRFPATFAHELAHKLQSERLFGNPMGRTIVEGSADFLKVLVLHSSGLIDEGQARQIIRKAVADCATLADEVNAFRERAEQFKMSFREPYDCGMAYYFVAYYSSNLPAPTFVNTLKRALSGETYVDDGHVLCLLFEPKCNNERLKGIAGNRSQFVAEAAWLERQLSSRPLPRL